MAKNSFMMRDVSLALDVKQTLQEKKNTYVDKILMKECHICDSIRPPQAYHCNICGRCMAFMDHHCPWVNNCVALYT